MLSHDIKLVLVYERKAEKLLTRNHSRISFKEAKELIMKAVRKLAGKKENIDLVKMRGEFEGYFRIRKNDLRIIFSIAEYENEIIVTIKNIDFRGSVYK